jgi:hypothetical protein
MKRYRLDLKKPRQLTPAEARRLDVMPIDYSDIPTLDDEFFKKAAEAWPPAKRQLTIRIDADVLDIRRVSIGSCELQWNPVARGRHARPPRPTRTPRDAADRSRPERGR